jgi:hypothetical protein
MAIVGNLPKGRGLGIRKISSTQAAITGTGAVATGLLTIDTGGAVACSANSALVTPWSFATITSIAAGTVNVVVVAFTSAPAIAASAAPINVNVIATGF